MNAYDRTYTHVQQLYNICDCTYARPPVRPGFNIQYIHLNVILCCFYVYVCMCVIYVYVLCMFINTCAYCSGVRYSQYSLRALEGDLTRYKIRRLRVGTVETPPGWECFPGTCGLVGSWESLLFCLDDKLKSKIMVILDFITQGLMNLKLVTIHICIIFMIVFLWSMCPYTRNTIYNICV